MPDSTALSPSTPKPETYEALLAADPVTTASAALVAGETMALESDADAALLVDLIKQVRNGERMLEEECKKATRPLDAAKKKIREWFYPHINKLHDGGEALKRRSREWRARENARRAAEAEAQRKAAEEAAKAEAESSGATEAPPPAVVPEPEKQTITRGVTGAASYDTKLLRCVVVDPARVPISWVMLDQPSAKQWYRSNVPPNDQEKYKQRGEEGVVLNGVRFYYIESSAVR